MTKARVAGTVRRFEKSVHNIKRIFFCVGKQMSSLYFEFIAEQIICVASHQILYGKNQRTVARCSCTYHAACLHKMPREFPKL